MSKYYLRNPLANLHYLNNKTTIFLHTKKIILSLDKESSNILTILYKNKTLTQKLVKKKLAGLVIEYLICENIIINIEKGGSDIVAQQIHHFMSNPNTHAFNLSSGAIRELYKNDIKKTVSKIIIGNWEKASPNVKKLPSNSITSSSFRIYSVSDKLVKQEEKNYQEFVQSIFNRTYQKKELYYSGEYGSGGAMHSIFPLLITDNGVQVYDAFNNLRHTKRGNKFKKQALECFFSKNGILLNKYGAIVILVSNLEFVCKKYSTRGLKFALLEGGAIGNLFRRFAHHYETKALEYGGYNEKKILKFIIKNNLFDIGHISVIHTIFLG